MIQESQSRNAGSFLRKELGDRAAVCFSIRLAFLTVMTGRVENARASPYKSDTGGGDECVHDCKKIAGGPMCRS